MSSSMDPGPKLRLLTNVLLLSDRSGRSRTLSPPLPPFRPRQAVGLVGILVSRSRELEIAVGTVFGFDDRLDRLLRTLNESSQNSDCITQTQRAKDMPECTKCNNQLWELWQCQQNLK